MVLRADEAAVVLQAVDESAKDASAEALYSRADGAVAMAQACLRHGAPDRSPVEIVVTVPLLRRREHALREPARRTSETSTRKYKFSIDDFHDKNRVT